MNRHQVLTGAANSGDSCFAVGSVEGTHFTAYGSGTTIVILASDFQRVQIIPSPLNGSNLEVSSISCCSDLGKIAASYGSTVCIFEPTPLSSHTSSHRLDYHWYQTGSIQIEGDVLAVKWNLEGTRLLVSGVALEMWQNLDVGHGKNERRPSFFIEDDDRFPSADQLEWTCVWKCPLANPVSMIKFTSDGLLFATAAENDRMVKVWYEDRKDVSMRPESSGAKDGLSFSFIYLAHPRAVTGFSWRRTSKYMHKGTVANMLLTSCKDNICRVWCETVLPEDGLLDTQQLEPKDAGSPFLAHRNKKRIVQRIHQIRHALHKRKKSSMSQINGNSLLVSTISLSDVQKFGSHSNGIVPSFHFHLGASINLNSDVPLIGSLGNAKNETFNFVMHWLDNKEFHATLEAEKLIDEMSHRPVVVEQRRSDLPSARISSPGRPQNGVKLRLPTIGSDPSIVETSKKHSSTLQKTKSYITMFSGRSSASTSDPQPDQDTSKVDQGPDMLEQSVERLVQSWHKESDMIYGIHPLDGSLVMWIVDNLDESTPGAFNQVKVSLSAMLPNAFPVFDALTMQPNVWLYCEYGRLGFKSLKLETDLKPDNLAPQKSQYRSNATGTDSSGRSDNNLMPNVLMVTKHINGSINMWQISFAENSQFSTVVNVSHASRASGHRFRTDSSACHPVLPLLLTTAHSKVPNKDVPNGANRPLLDVRSVSICDPTKLPGYVMNTSCSSELILWQVAPVGPLSKSGGIRELARINSAVPLAFCKVTWFPTLLPVSCLGTVSNSPSALFVASDGVSLRIYQAVLDGRLILAEQQTRRKRPSVLRSFSDCSNVGEESDWISDDVCSPWNIVSVQSTSRPGCIIDLKPIRGATQNWENIQLLHVFQDLLVSGCKLKHQGPDCCSPKKSGEGNTKGSFEERFYLVIIEKMDDGSSVLKMWLITVASQDCCRAGGSCKKELETSSPFHITTEKVCSQSLQLPNGISVTMATVAAGHLSSSSIYPACFAPYLLSTACTDGRVRFWQCDSSKDCQTGKTLYQWKEWTMITAERGTSDITVEGKILSVSSAYSGRIAVAHQVPQTANLRPSVCLDTHYVQMRKAPSASKALNNQDFGLCVTVYECESSGGAKWTLEDTIEIPNVVIADSKVDIDLSRLREQQEADHSGSPLHSNFGSAATLARTPAVPSSAAVHSIRRHLYQQDSARTGITFKHRTHLDWVSTEDGSHILTLSVGSKILLYTATSVESNAWLKTNGRMLPAGKAYMMTVGSSEVRWVMLRTVELLTADEFPPLPKHLTWVRNGILVVGMENEMHVYSQWKLPEAEDGEETGSEAGKSCATMRRSRTLSKTMSGIKLNASIANLTLLAQKKARRCESHTLSKVKLPTIETGYAMRVVDECGLFEAARLANPCLPQYHPKQLLELLISGKMCCVRLIMSHLLHCLIGRTITDKKDGASDSDPVDQTGKSPSVGESEESEMNIVEVTSIPPLPLYILLYADSDPTKYRGSPQNDAHRTANYDGLFFSTGTLEADSIGLNDENVSKTPMNNEYGPEQAQLLAKHLEHTNLPGLSSLDQINLVMLSNALVKLTLDGDGSNVNGKKKFTDIIDDCGLRFLFAAHQHTNLADALPSPHKEVVQQQGLPSAFYIWAFHSKNKRELLTCLPWRQSDEVTWEEVKQFGIGWWLNDSETLTNLIEKVAKTTFQVNKDPIDVALYYVALRKKNVLAHLFKMNGDSAKHQFFKNDFSEDRWRKAALKNAFRLLGKQQFQKTAAFFLLAGAVSDAVKVCLNQMKDIQLAMVILRLYEGGPLDGINPACKRLLYTEILGCDENNANYDTSKASHDPFLRSMTHWMLADYKAALDTLLVENFGKDLPEAEKEFPWKTFTGHKSSIFNIYRYLRLHPQVIEKKFPPKKGLPTRNGMDAINCISPMERQLYFRTAHTYFRGGCPLLALEVLTKMPSVVDSAADEEPTEKPTQVLPAKTSSNSLLDAPQSSDIDWSQPVSRFDDDDKLDLSFGPSSSDEEEDEKRSLCAVDLQQNHDDGTENDQKQGTSVEENKSAYSIDIMAQQLNFIAIVKILVSELATLATGFEVDGGQLRYQLYVWLEKEMEVLNNLCYTGNEDDEEDEEAVSEDGEILETSFSGSTTSSIRSSGRLLHETILAEKTDFEAKLRRMARRKKWLEANEQVLGTLLSYSILHGSSASGLASMQMELLLLLQELQQAKMPQQLRSPIPFPTSLPLLSASIACTKTVISDPIRHLQSMCQDLLHTLIEFKTAPATDITSSKVCLLRDLSIALSACIYQSLCDSDSFVMSATDDVEVGLEGFTSVSVVYKDSYLMAGAQKRTSATNPRVLQTPSSQPATWPGVSSLVVLMNQKRDEDTPKLNVLLMEALVAVFMSLLCYSLAVYDAIVLYRLVAHPLEDGVWPLLFGGGQRKPVRVSVSSDAKAVSAKADHNANIRSRLHRQVFGPTTLNNNNNDNNNDRAMFQEEFIAPQTNMISYFLAKVEKSENQGVDYDSADSVTSDDDDDDEENDFESKDETMNSSLQEESRDDFNDDTVFSSPKSGQQKRIDRFSEHIKPNSYSWCLMRYAAIKYVLQYLKTFLPKIGMDFSDLPMRSPLVHSIMKNLEVWEGQLRTQMEAFSGPPDGYIPGCSVDASLGVNIVKYSALANPNHTPFLSTHYSALPAKRLWHYLVTRESLHDVFIRYVFGKGRSFTDLNASEPFYKQSVEMTKIIYKDQETITCFSLIPSIPDSIVVATQKELVEMNIGSLLGPLGRNSLIEVIQNSDNAFDDADEIFDTPTPKINRFLSVDSFPHNSTVSSSSPPISNGLTPDIMGRGSQVLQKRMVSGIRKVTAHPLLPYYITGSQDGSLKLWEFGRVEPVAEPRRTSAPYPKPTRLLFNSHGNKFGVSDVDGRVSLWQLGHNLVPGLPFVDLKCHNKGVNDFVFVGSSSLLATAGHSSDNFNVCLWDTLLPKNKSLVKGFHCNSDGCSALVYAPYHQVLISGGKKGELYIFDVRQRQLRHTFQAHGSSVKCISFDPTEDCFATGSSDGEVKVWGLTVHNLLYSFQNDRSRSSRFRSSGVGVSELHLGPGGQLFSSSTDGSLRYRLLTLRHPVVSNWQNDNQTFNTHF